MSAVAWVRLELHVDRFNDDAFAAVMARVTDGGITLATLEQLGNTTANQRLMYELNAECATDIPDRGPFFTWDEYRRARVDVSSFDPRGVVVARDGDRWVGLAATSDHRQRGFVFNEMTGVIRTYRGRGIALAMKVHGMSFPPDLRVGVVRTVHHPANEAMITLNRKLGYVDASWVLPEV